MTDLQARIGPRVFPHRTWIRPGYHPPKTSHKHRRQNDGSEQEALNIFGAAGHPRDPSIGSEHTEESGHSDLGTIPTRRGRSNPDQLPYPTHSLGRSLSSSSSLLQRMGMGISPDTQIPPDATVDWSAATEKSLIKRMDTPPILEAETGGSDTPSRICVSEPSPKTRNLTRRHTENSHNVAYPNTTSLPLNLPERVSPDGDSQQSGLSTAFTLHGRNGSSTLNDPWNSASPVPALVHKTPDNTNQHDDGSENHKFSSVANGYQAASSPERVNRRDSLTPFSELDDHTDTLGQPPILRHSTSQFPHLNGGPSYIVSPPTEETADNILLPLTQKNAFERSKHTPPGTYDNPVSVNPDVITREEISSFNDRIPAIAQELCTLRYTPSPDRDGWPESPPTAEKARQASSILRIEQGYTHSHTYLPSRESEFLNHPKPERYLPRRSVREKVPRSSLDLTERRAVRKKKSSHRSLSPSQIPHSLPDEGYPEPRRSWSPTHSDGPRRSRRRPSSTERSSIPRHHNQLSQSQSRGEALFDQYQPRRLHQMSLTSKERPRNGYVHRNDSHHWHRQPDDSSLSELPRKHPPLESQEAVFLRASARTAHDVTNISVPLPALQGEPEPKHAFLPCHNIPGLWLAQQGLDNIGISTVAFEVDDMTATAWRIPSPHLKDVETSTAENESKLALLLCCFDRHGFETALQTLGTSIPSGDLVDAVLKMETVWPPEGHLIISVNADNQEGSTYLPHNIMSSLFLRIESNVHKGTNLINLIQLSDMSDFMFVLLAQEHLDTPRWKLETDVDRATGEHAFAILEDSIP